MIPWHTGGVYSAATLGVATLSYLPYYFLGIVTPILCVVMAFFNVGTFRTASSPEASEEA